MFLVSNKKKSHVKYSITTLLVFLIIILFSQIPLNLTFLDPVGQALNDFDLYDIVYSKFKAEEPVDTNIVLVNIGSLDRIGIANEVRIINQYKPSVIAIDAFFTERKDRLSDSILSHELSECKNLVLTSKLEDYSDEKYNTLITSIDEMNAFAVNGYANLPNDNSKGFRTIRLFKPFAFVNNSVLPSFDTKIVELYSGSSYLTLKERNEKFEEINYLGNTDKFYTLDVNQALDPGNDLSFIKDKIVLLGYIGENFNTKTFEDVFFTPCNVRYAGKSFPDMYGVVIHANIISMILHKRYINRMPEGLTIIIAVLLSYLNLWFFYFLKRKIKDWFGGITKLILFLQSILYLFISIFCFYWFFYKINLTLIIVAVFLSTTAIDLAENYLGKIKILRQYFEYK